MTNLNPGDQQLIRSQPGGSSTAGWVAAVEGELDAALPGEWCRAS